MVFFFFLSMNLCVILPDITAHRQVSNIIIGTCWPVVVVSQNSRNGVY